MCNRAILQFEVSFWWWMLRYRDYDIVSVTRCLCNLGIRSLKATQMFDARPKAQTLFESDQYTVDAAKPTVDGSKLQASMLKSACKDVPRSNAVPLAGSG